MTKIAIRFGDNDFHSTWTGVLETIAQSFIYGDEDITKDKAALIKALNQLAYPCYFVFQYRWDLEGKSNSTYKEINEDYYRKYLNIEADRVYLNEEVDKYEKETDWNNGETFVLEYNSYHGSYTIYSI